MSSPDKKKRNLKEKFFYEMAESYFILHGWLRSGNCGAARGAVEFLKEALAL